MEKTTKTNVFFAIITVIAIIITIFVLSKPVATKSTEDDSKEYEKNIQLLNDTIRQLKQDITGYTKEIERFDLERDSIRKEIQRIIESNEKIDATLANGDWDVNIQFLTDFLSQEDTVGK